MLDAQSILPTLTRTAEETAQTVPKQIAFLDAISTTLQAQKEVLVERFEALLERFEAEARADLLSMLAQSEATARHEITSYGVRELGDPLGTVTMDDNDNARGLRTGLKDLAEYRRQTLRPLQRAVPLASAASGLIDFTALLKLWSDILSLNPNVTQIMSDPFYSAVHAQEFDVRQQLLAAQYDYAKLRAALAGKYPIVHRIAERVDENSDKEDVAKAIYLHTQLVLKNIEQIRAEAIINRPAATRKQVVLTLDIDPVERVVHQALNLPQDLWHIHRVIMYTLQRMGFEPGDLGHTMVERILARIPEARSAREEFWDMLSLVLGFLAAPTGGASLIVVGVISSMRAIREIAEHNEQLTLLTSFQLLVDLVTYGFDIFEAGKIISKLARPVTRAARLKMLNERLKVLESLTGRPRAAKKLLMAEEKLAKKELAEAIAAAQKTAGKDAGKIKNVLEETEKRASKKRGAAAAKEKGQGAKKPAKPKTPKAAASGASVAANDLVSTRRLAEDALIAVKRQFPELAPHLDALLHTEDWQKIMTRIDGFERAVSHAAYEGLLHNVQGDLLELMIPHFPEFKEALQSAAARIALAPGTWSEVRVARIVEASGAAGRRKFSDFIFWAEGTGADNKGYVLLLNFIEAKSGESTSLFRTIIKQGSKTEQAVGQLGRIEQRLRSVIWLDSKPTSFENLVYILPRADLDPAQQLTKYVAVIQEHPTWENVGDLVASQNLNADVWISPVKQDKLRAMSDVLLRTAGKSPKVTIPLGPLVRPVVRQAVRQGSDKE